MTVEKTGKPRPAQPRTLAGAVRAVQAKPAGPQAPADALGLAAQGGVAPKAAVATVLVPLRDGDSIEGIAARELGDEGRWQEIYDLNRELFGALGDNGVLSVGTLIKIPAPGAAAPRPAAARAKGGLQAFDGPDEPEPAFVQEDELAMALLVLDLEHLDPPFKERVADLLRDAEAAGARGPAAQVAYVAAGLDRGLQAFIGETLAPIDRRLIMARGIHADPAKRAASADDACRRAILQDFATLSKLQATSQPPARPGAWADLEAIITATMEATGEELAAMGRILAKDLAAAQAREQAR